MNEAAQKLMLTFELVEAGIAMYEARMRRENPDADDHAVEALVRAWLASSPPEVPGPVRALSHE